ncbi:hypothetical protein QR680_008863 [Steinernema hermaphroditum]|uniref:TAFII28-like protein domain-containing protein n=1 Tax=Steinernema hermaphroditum TaxID=289476 RepID=A0AA39M8N3_9BILA|nr:hypothetical protein QR680_008863 [Steinernema hermaphroditum]
MDTPSTVVSDVTLSPPSDRSESESSSTVSEENVNMLKKQILLGNLTSDQLDRYEAYRKVSFSQMAIRRIIGEVTGVNACPNVVTAISGLAKVVAGEIVEEAFEISQKEGNAKIEPEDVRKGFESLRTKGRLFPMPGSRKNPFGGEF